MSSPPKAIQSNANVGRALKLVRRARNVSQGAFDLASSRVYLSAVERGLKQPTLPKLDQFADVIGIHPLTLLAFCYLDSLNMAGLLELLEQVRLEAVALNNPPV